MRRSATEPTSARIVTGGYGLADLVVADTAIAAADARRALFDVVSTYGADTLSAGGRNRLYLRSANTGNVDLAAVRHRLYELDVATSPIVPASRGNEVVEARPAGTSGVAQIEWDVPATPAGTRVFLLAIADTAAHELNPTVAVPGLGPFTDLEAIHTFCLARPNAAIRELIVG